MEEVKALYVVWDALRDAKCDYYFIHIRRQALLKLREKIGAEAFAAGQMPPYVPMWRFSEVRP